MNALAILLLGALSQTNDQEVAELKEVMAANSAALDAAITCIDAQTKTVLKEHYFEADANVVVDLAMESCEEHFAEMRSVLSRSQYLIDQAEELTSDSRKRVRVSFVEHVEKIFLKPEFSEIRAKMATLKLSECVREKVRIWANQPSEPDVLAKAAVSACSDDWSSWKAMQRYSLRSQKATFSVDEFETDFKARMVENATVWVFEARAR